jgi:nucleoside-diphosphate-sugar epimerase
MTMPVCAVTGANGFVGKAITRRFQMLGRRVIALVRKPEQAPVGTEARQFILGDPVAPHLLDKIDILLHAAYDFSVYHWSDICRVNVVGSEYLFDAAKRAGVKRQIFISSMAAFEGCWSHYGRGKLVVENSVRARGGVAIRPGMIYGEQNGGLAAQIATMARKWPVIPMIGDGHYPIYTCHIDDLCDLIIHLAQAAELLNDILTAANSSPVTLRQIAKSADENTPPMLLPIPWRCLALGLRIMELIGLRPGFRSDSVVSIAHANPSVDFEAVKKKYYVHFRPFEGAISP